MKDKYVYPAIFDYADDGISIEFPDLPGCLSCADTDEEALYMAEDVLGLWMLNLEEDKEEIPEPSKLNDIKIETNQKTVLISVWMPTIRKAINNKSIKKTLTIPQWLDFMAREKDLNFSFILQEALKKELQISK
ncbi:type II toxin-antitoxin system HicB family antitoxin [Helcococcus ovis]|uniref:type II toxin-antitoxin system HicB family antitoxin n=1 Tax=Helcococcus ovis TaxID=72026 RepID=UPI00106F827D|nr:type II toxin-antitoxin system HicB family antitoxin [Helcococcus ovis]TFF68350.1 type II toxin-antitoxin system HicB family antitoxin [Helcococcus ovis]WNZ00895.1 type II toxin-antitoxin system HicB family antitoxin [Helcococcus ovis]